MAESSEKSQAATSWGSRIVGLSIVLGTVIALVGWPAPARGQAATPPSIAWVSPTWGYVGGGTPVTIAGANFSSGAVVTFDGVRATSTFLNAELLTAVAPGASGPGINAVTIRVTNTDGQHADYAPYNYAPVAIVKIDPSFGPLAGGTPVTLSGLYFAEGATVTFGGVAATDVTVQASSSMTVTTPPVASAGPTTVRVTNPDGWFREWVGGFLYRAPEPTISSVSPSEGPNDRPTVLTIRGANFAPGVTVSTCSAPPLPGMTVCLTGGQVTAVTQVDSATITATLSPMAPVSRGTIEVVVTNPDGGSGSAPFTFLNYPRLATLTPTFGPPQTMVTIFGQDFGSDAEVSFGGVAAPIVSRAPAELVVMVPDQAAGVADVTITTTAGSRSRTFPSMFTVGTSPLVVGSVGPVERLTIASDGTELPAEGPYQLYSSSNPVPVASQDGRHIAFSGYSATTAEAPLYVRDTVHGTTSNLGTYDAGRGGMAMSGDGRFIALASPTRGAVVIDRDVDRNNVYDEPGEGKTSWTVVSVREDDGQPVTTGISPTTIAISDDGRYVAFVSPSPALVAGKTTSVGDPFVRDRDLDGDGVFDEAGQARTVRVGMPRGGQANGDVLTVTLTPDGRFIGFSSNASNLVPGATGTTQVYVHDRDADDDGVFDEADEAATALVCVTRLEDGTLAGGASPSLSADGRFVAFGTWARLVAGKTTSRIDVFIADRDSDGNGTFDEAPSPSFVRASVTKAGVEGNGDASLAPTSALTRDGRYVVFHSWASNLTFDVNGAHDVFRFDRLTGELLLASATAQGGRTDSTSPKPPDSAFAVVAGDGSRIAFRSNAANLAIGDTNALPDVFVKTVGAPNTPTGSNVAVAPVETTTGRSPVSLVFRGVSSAGTATVTSLPSPPTTAPPAETFSLVGAYYEIATTAQFSGPVQVCLSYPFPLPEGVLEGSLAVLHYEASTWVPLQTTSQDFAKHVICGQASSLSPFAVFSRTAPTDSVPPVIINSPRDQTVEASSPAGAEVSWTLPTAHDAVSGDVPVVCEPAPGSVFPLGTTSVTCSASDAAGNVEREDFRVEVRDTTLPVIAITAPATATYLLNEAVVADYTCSDSGSGIASCTGTAAAGDAVDTSTAGERLFTVTARDRAGNEAVASVRYSVRYSVEVLFDQHKARNAGATVPIKVRLLDAAGANVSRANVAVAALGVAKLTNVALDPVEDSGNANPDSDFRFADESDSYVFNLKTTGFTTGRYSLHFRCGTDPTSHTVQFSVR